MQAYISGRVGDAVEEQVAESQLGVCVMPVLVLAQQLLLQNLLGFVPLALVLVGQVQRCCTRPSRYLSALLAQLGKF